MPLVCGLFFYQRGRAQRRLVDELELRRKTEENLSRAVHTDQLTGIANRVSVGARSSRTVIHGIDAGGPHRTFDARSRPF
ncbi:hypothetical protein LP421_29070 [Rhizobium sp. RCAM05350]|nr:hypothetical protein LP421_29070 [Rhizobium sp. RCAM05350]